MLLAIITLARGSALLSLSSLFENFIIIIIIIIILRSVFRTYCYNLHLNSNYANTCLEQENCVICADEDADEAETNIIIFIILSTSLSYLSIYRSF